MGQLAIAWCLINPNVSTVITGASKPEQVEENLDAYNLAESLNEDYLNEIERILDNKPTSLHDFR